MEASDVEERDADRGSRSPAGDRREPSPAGTPDRVPGRPPGRHGDRDGGRETGQRIGPWLQRRRTGDARVAHRRGPWRLVPVLAHDHRHDREEHGHHTEGRERDHAPTRVGSTVVVGDTGFGHEPELHVLRRCLRRFVTFAWVLSEPPRAGSHGFAFTGERCRGTHPPHERWRHDRLRVHAGSLPASPAPSSRPDTTWSSSPTWRRRRSRARSAPSSRCTNASTRSW